MQRIGTGQLVRHGRILERPTRQPKNTNGSVAYELGKGFQLDKTHCLLVASMDAQGGGDKAVGNDGFIFETLADIQSADAIPLNWPEADYPLKSGRGTAWMAKFPANGCFVPLHAKLPDGTAHPAAGTGLLVSTGMTFNADGSSAEEDSEVTNEFMQVRWDGKRLEITEREFIDNLCGYELCGAALSYYLADGDSFLAPLSTDKGIVVFRLGFDGRRWHVTETGQPFASHYEGKTLNVRGESESSIQRWKDRYILYTRGGDPVGRLYSSTDGLNFKLCGQRYNNTVPQVLNKGLDGCLYIATNPNMDILRNPLVAYPLVDDSFDYPNCTGEPVVIHDQDGVRDCSGDSIPFIDHAVAVNLFLEGQWRHLIWYRVCDLKERTPHSFQPDLKQLLGEPKPRAEFGGLYLAELQYDNPVEPGFGW